MLESGRWTIGEGATSLTSLIQDGWTGKNEALAFSDVLKQVKDIFGPRHPSSQPRRPVPGEYYETLESRCQDWLRRARRHPGWKHVDEYVSACTAVGREADLDIWR